MAGRTVTRRLSEREASLYQEWIANDRQLRTIVEEVRTIAEQARELILSADKEGEGSSVRGKTPPAGG